VRERVAANSEPLKELLEHHGKVEKGEFTAQLNGLMKALHDAAAGKLPPNATPVQARMSAATAVQADAFLKDLSSDEEMKPIDAAHRLYATKNAGIQAAWGRVAN